MKKRTYVGAVTRPISLTAAIRVENPYSAQDTSQYGTVNQAYDTIAGTYTPNRQLYPTLLGLHVLLSDPNNATPQSEVTWGVQNTVAWEVERGGVTQAITSQSTGDFTLSGHQLRVKLNQTVADGNVIVRATGTFYDSVGRVQTATAELPLGLNTTTVTNLTLLRDGLGTAGNVGDFFRLNPLTLDTVAKLDNASNWKKRCAVQLCDGATPLADAFTYILGDTLDEDAYLTACSEGTAFYFWYYRTPDNRLVQCTEDTEWIDAAWFPGGSASRVVSVDLTKVKHVLLVCRAGYIPYGEMVDYLDDDGLLRPEKLNLGFRETTFDVGVELPDVERIEVADIAHCRLERTELSSIGVTVVKRALVMAGGTTLNDLTELSPHAAGTPSWVEKLYAIKWWVTKANGDDVLIGTGEWLQISPHQLAVLYGGALDADNMPLLSVSVEPLYPKLTGNNYVEGYVRGASAVTPSQQQGNKGFLKQLDFWLIDTTDNAGATTRGMKLQRNNILRFAGGGWAPAVRISTAMAADAAHELWRRNAGGTYVKYCDAGAYDPEAYVEGVLRPYFRGTLTGWYAESDGGWPRLYRSDGGGGYIEAHAVLPWETTETKYTIGIGYAFGVYLLDHQKRDDGEWEWNGIFTDVQEWDGIDFSKYYLPPTAFSPCPSTQIVENSTTVFRNFFYLAHPQGGIGGASALGVLGSTMFNETGRAYAKVDDVSALTNATRARANNSVSGRSYPFAEGGWHTLNTLITSQELLYSRRNPFIATMFGSGISSNDACSDEDSWRTNGGVRYRVDGASGYSYVKWSGSLPVKSEAGGTKSASEELNNYHAKEQCMESQLVASFAAEFGFAETIMTDLPLTYTVYGGTYYWMKPYGVESLTDGYMNARIYKEVTDVVTGYDTGGSLTTCEVTAILRMSLMGGMNLSGDIYAYAQGGAEVIGVCYVDPATSRTGNPLESFLIPDQKSWKNDSQVSVDLGTSFLIEGRGVATRTAYGVNLADGYYARRFGYSPIKAEAGGGLNSYECCYGYTRNEWAATTAKRVRIALRFRGFASYTYCSPRSWFANFSASITTRNIGGSAQALIGT